MLAEKGFNMHELASIHQAEAKLPAFMKGNAQLTTEEVQESKELAVV